MRTTENTALNLNPPPKVLTARYMLADQSEHACQVKELTLDGATFVASTIPPSGQTLIAYVEDVGRIEAVTGNPTSNGFSIRYAMQGARLERLQQRIIWLRDNASGARNDQRRHVRYEPVEKSLALTLTDGRVYPCEVIDISTSGAGVKTDIMPSIGTQLMLGKMRGRVVRYIEEGVAIEFVKQLDQSQMPAVKGFSRH